MVVKDERYPSKVLHHLGRVFRLPKADILQLFQICPFDGRSRPSGIALEDSGRMIKDRRLPAFFAFNQ